MIRELWQKLGQPLTASLGHPVTEVPQVSALAVPAPAGMQQAVARRNLLPPAASSNRGAAFALRTPSWKSRLPAPQRLRGTTVSHLRGDGFIGSFPLRNAGDAEVAVSSCSF